MLPTQSAGYDMLPAACRFHRCIFEHMATAAFVRTVLHTHGAGGCAHEATQKHTGGVRNLGYHFNRNVQYLDEADNTPRGRQLSETTTWAPIRINLQYVSTTGAGALESWLTETLLPAAVTWLEAALQVSPTTGTLKAARFCAASYSSGVCAEEGAPPTCGVAAGGGDYTIPDSMLDSLESCTTCYTNGDPCEGCTTSPAGAGATGDFVLFVSSVTAASCSGGTLAYASTCQRDQKDRPILVSTQPQGPAATAPRLCPAAPRLAAPSTLLSMLTRRARCHAPSSHLRPPRATPTFAPTR